MGVGEGVAETLTTQTAELLKACYALLVYLQTNVLGDLPKTTAPNTETQAGNPIDSAMSQIQYARELIAETQALLSTEVIGKLR